MQLNDARRVLLKEGWLAGEDRVFQTAVLDRAVLMRIEIGSPIFRAGDFGGGLYGLAQGAFGVYVPGEYADDILAHIIRPGRWFGYGPALTRRRRILSFAAVEPSVVLHVPLAALDQLIATDPRYPLIVKKISEFGMDVAITVVSNLLIPDADKRIAATLLRIAPPTALARGQPPMITGVTQAQIGEMANAARDFVNRTLKRFEAQGWIAVSYRKITLLDPNQMRAFCQD